MFVFCRKSDLSKKFSLSISSSGGDTWCFVKKLPFEEDEFAKFKSAEGVLESRLDASIRSDILKTVQPWSTSSPMRKQKKQKPMPVDNFSSLD